MQKQEHKLINEEIRQISICNYSFEEYLNLAESFHGYKAPGIILGGFMVDAAIKKLPEKLLFDAVCETPFCLPDAIQILTPCTTGNGWLKVINLGRYALNLYDKYSGDGIRVAVDSAKLEEWSEIRTWFLKLKEKKDQDTPLLLAQIREAGSDICKIQDVHIKPQLLEKRHKKGIVICPVCGEAYPMEHGRICRGCMGEAPYFSYSTAAEAPPLMKIPVEQAIGHHILHDMTQVIPGENKAPAFRKGETVSVGDICRLQQMGRQNIYTVAANKNLSDSDWVHEDEAVLGFAKAMAGEGVIFKEPPSEGKINFIAATDGMLLLNEKRLEIFNMLPGVMCAARKNYTILTKGRNFAGTRAIPLYLPRTDFGKAMSILSDGHLFEIKPLKKANIGIMVTGTEIFNGIIQDKFIPIIRSKVKKYGCKVVQAIIVPDDPEAINKGINDLLQTGTEILITTAGLSVDPDDITRQGLINAGAEDVLYGAPILPGAMTLLARIGNVKVFGVPACALFFKTTSFDLLFPRLLADIPITRNDLAKLGHGAFCQECKTCKYPKCSFGK